MDHAKPSADRGRSGERATELAPSHPAPIVPSDTGWRSLPVKGQRVTLDRELARLFGVTTKRLNEQLRRNLARFTGYAFRLADPDMQILRSQSSSGWGSRRSLPWVFTRNTARSWPPRS